MVTRIFYFEGADQYKDDTTCVDWTVGMISAELKKQYKYRPTKETLWGEIVQEDKTVARFELDVKNWTIKAITKITEQDFKQYCLEHGIFDGVYVEFDDCFQVMTKTTHMTSFIASKFTNWSDTVDSKGNYNGYTLSLMKIDLHNTAVTGQYFSKIF